MANDITFVHFRYGTYDEINNSANNSTLNPHAVYIATDKKLMYAKGAWIGVTSVTSEVNQDTGEIKLKFNYDSEGQPTGNPITCTISGAGMTTEQKTQLATAYDFVTDIAGTSADSIINKWQEVVDFLAGIEGGTLEGIVTTKADKTTTIIAGNGLTGGGDLSANRTVTLGTPSTITDSSTNSVTADSHTHAIDEASTSKRGIVQLNDSLTSTSTDQALTANQGKVLGGKIADEATARLTADTKHTADIKSITDLVNDMFEKVTDNGTTYIKTKYGFASDKFVSAGGTNDTESGGSGGANLTQMWESLQNNNDTFKDRLINVAHIPTLTTSKISDFVSATQAIADNAVANKADKDKVVDLTSNQTITGEKTFSKLKVSNTTLVPNLNADKVDGYDSSVLLTCESGNAIDVNAPHPNKKSGTLLYKISANCANIPPYCNNGVLVHFNRPSTDTAFQLASNYSNTGLYYRSGDLNESSTAYLYNKDWKKLAFTDDVLPRTGGTLTGALTVNAPINNTGALKLLGASEVSSTGMAVGEGAKALAVQSRALGQNSHAGLRTGNSTYPSAVISPYDLLPFTVNGETVYGTPIKANSKLTYTYNGTSYTVENTTNYTQVLVLITVGSDFVAGVTQPLNKCALTYSKGYSLGYGQRVLAINELSDTIRAITIYTWVQAGTDETDFINHFVISNSDKFYAFKGVSLSTASGNFSVASGNNSVASGANSVASGYYSVASGNNSVASGYCSVASGNYSVASGNFSVASGYYSVASGYNSVASGYYSVASGYYSVASGNNSVASGANSVASGYCSVASGNYSVASHESSKVFATRGISGRTHQTVLGLYNAEDANSALVVGWGSSDTNRKNVFTVNNSGNVSMGNKLSIGVGGRNEVYLVSEAEDQLYVHTSAGIPFLIQRDDIRRGSNAPKTTLGTDQYKWFNVFTESLKIADANLTYDIGTLTIDKALKTTSTLTAAQGVFSNYIKIGDATISWDFQNNCLAIDYGLYSTKFISAGGVVTGDASGGTGGVNLMEIWNSLQGNTDNFGTAKIHIDHIPIEAILSNGAYEADVANRINTFAYSGSESFTSAVKGLITVSNIPTLPTTKINGLDTTLEAIYTTLEANTNNISQNASNIAILTSANNDHEERIKALEQALTWQTV